MDASGEVVDVSGEVVDVSGEVVDVSAPFVDASGNPIAAPPPAPAPAPVTIADILAATELVLQKETADKARLEAIGGITVETLRTALIHWGVLGFPNAWVLHSSTITPPQVCSDGVTRGLEDYIVFCSGKTIGEHIAALQEKVASSEITLGFANISGMIAVTVTRA
jgi:hypothetical protein